MKPKYGNILVLGNPQSDPSTSAFLNKFIIIIQKLSSNVYLISGDKPETIGNMTWIKTNYNNRNNLIFNIINFLTFQFKLIISLLQLRNKIDVVFVLPISSALPIILLKLLNKKIIVFAAQKNSDIIILKLLEKITFKISDIIIVESDFVIKELKIDRYRHKILKGNLFIDLNFFKKNTDISKRSNVVGYIGGLNHRKGTVNLIKAINLISNKDREIKLIIGGFGPLKTEIQKISKKNTVEYVGVIPQNELPVYLNKFKLLILPSLSEGVPNIVLEAMSCGTPVIATQVGGIPEIIHDNKTGFILKNNSPECIAEAIISVLKRSDLEIITRSAKELINQEFTLAKSIERYTQIIEKLNISSDRYE